MQFLALVLSFFFLGSQAALSTPAPLVFSAVEQCGPARLRLPVTNAAKPLSLTVIPLGSVPISIPIEEAMFRLSTDGTSYEGVVWLPLPAGTEFIASLQDTAGKDITRISDIVRVLPSTNASCVREDVAASGQPFPLTGNLSQCEALSLIYNTSSADHPPSLQLFMPLGFSQTLPLVSAGDGKATYTLAAFHTSAVVLVLSHGASGGQQASTLLMVGGDTNSRADCIPSEFQQLVSSFDGSNDLPSVRRPALVVVAISLATLALMLNIISILYCFLHRRCLPREPSPGDSEKGSDHTEPSRSRSGFHSRWAKLLGRRRGISKLIDTSQKDIEIFLPLDKVDVSSSDTPSSAPASAPTAQVQAEEVPSTATTTTMTMTPAPLEKQSNSVSPAKPSQALGASSHKIVARRPPPINTMLQRRRDDPGPADVPEAVHNSPLPTPPRSHPPPPRPRRNASLLSLIPFSYHESDPALYEPRPHVVEGRCATAWRETQAMPNARAETTTTATRRTIVRVVPNTPPSRPLPAIPKLSRTIYRGQIRLDFPIVREKSSDTSRQI